MEYAVPKVRRSMQQEVSVRQQARDAFRARPLAAQPERYSDRMFDLNGTEGGAQGAAGQISQSLGANAGFSSRSETGGKDSAVLPGSGFGLKGAGMQEPGINAAGFAGMSSQAGMAHGAAGDELIRRKLGYGVGDLVRHQKFGEGMVVKIASGGRDYEVTVQFHQAGVKKMFAAFAKLKKAD